MSELLRCLECNRVKVGSMWHLEGTITAVEMTTHVDTYCPRCKKKLAEQQKSDQLLGSDSKSEEGMPS